PGPRSGAPHGHQRLPHLRGRLRAERGHDGHRRRRPGAVLLHPPRRGHVVSPQGLRHRGARRPGQHARRGPRRPARRRDRGRGGPPGAGRRRADRPLRGLRGHPVRPSRGIAGGGAPVTRLSASVGLALLSIVGAALVPVATRALIGDDDYWLQVLIWVMFFAYLSAAWNLIGGFGGQYSIGHAGLLGIGAYTSSLLYVHAGVSPWLGMLAGGCAALGVHPARAKLLAMVLSSFFTAVGGTFYAQLIGFITPTRTMSLDFSVQMVVMPVLGGIGTVLGPLWGALVLVPIGEVTRALW